MERRSFLEWRSPKKMVVMLAGVFALNACSSKVDGQPMPSEAGLVCDSADAIVLQDEPPEYEFHPRTKDGIAIPLGSYAITAVKYGDGEVATANINAPLTHLYDGSARPPTDISVEFAIAPKANSPVTPSTCSTAIDISRVAQ